MKCPQCKTELKKVSFDLGYGVDVASLHCQKCGFNVTKDDRLRKALSSLREQMAKEVKVIKVGTGLGVRFPNEIVKSFDVKKGKILLVKPEADGVKLMFEN